jgi:hypothetical protein
MTFGDSLRDATMRHPQTNKEPSFARRRFIGGQFVLTESHRKSFRATIRLWRMLRNVSFDT